MIGGAPPDSDPLTRNACSACVGVFPRGFGLDNGRSKLAKSSHAGLLDPWEVTGGDDALYPQADNPRQKSMLNTKIRTLETLEVFTSLKPNPLIRSGTSLGDAGTLGSAPERSKG